MINPSLQQDGKSPYSNIVLKRYNIGLHNVSNVHLINSLEISSRKVDFRDYKSFTDFFQLDRIQILVNFPVRHSWAL